MIAAVIDRICPKSWYFGPTLNEQPLADILISDKILNVNYILNTKTGLRKRT